MATITSTTSGDYSVWGTWVWWIAPVLGDKVVIANGHTVTLDWAISAWDDGTSVIYSGSKSIQMDPARAYSVWLSGLTAGQAAELTQIYNRVDENVSAIAVWWNPYIGDMKKGMNSVIKKIEEKWEEVKEKIESEIKTIVIPEQKEPIVNVTTEKIDTEWFMKAIKDIPAPVVNVTTETVNIDPIITEIKAIGKIQDIKFPEFPEHKEADMSWMEKCMEEIEEKIENIPDNTQSIHKIEEYINKKEEEERNEEKMKEEEENMNRPLPNSFTATLK